MKRARLTSPTPGPSFTASVSSPLGQPTSSLEEPATFDHPDLDEPLINPVPGFVDAQPVVASLEQSPPPIPQLFIRIPRRNLVLPRDILPQPSALFVQQTRPDDFGVYRLYKGVKPSRHPERDLSLEDVADDPAFRADPDVSNDLRVYGIRNTVPGSTSVYAPFANWTEASFTSWFDDGKAVLSQERGQRLIDTVITDPRFESKDLKGFKISTALKLLEQPKESNKDPIFSSNVWYETDIVLSLPCSKHKFKSEADAPKLRIPGLQHRDFVEILESFFSLSSFNNCQLAGFEERIHWGGDEANGSSRIYGEIFTSTNYLEMQAEVQQLARDLYPDDPMENIAAPIVLYSDGTQLGSYGNASLSAGYAYGGLESEYIRVNPASLSASHFAYFPKVCRFYFLS